MSYVPNILNSKEQFVNKSDIYIHLVQHTTEGWAEHKHLSKSLDSPLEYIFVSFWCELHS